MAKLEGNAKKVFVKYQSDILKRVFSVKNEGACVRACVAEETLKRAIEELDRYYTKEVCCEQ